MERLTAEVAALREATQTEPNVISVSSGAVSPGIETDGVWPGSKRVTVKRSAVGGLIPVPAAGGLVLPSNRHRIGGNIVNTGNVGVTLVLDRSGDSASYGRIWLAPSGGSWDFQLANLLWAGAIYAVPDGGVATSVAVAEV